MKKSQLRNIIREVINEQSTQTGDSNNDWTVNTDDLSAVLNHWLQTVPTGTDGDVVGSVDGLVNNSDLTKVVDNMNQSTNPPTNSSCDPTMDFNASGTKDLDWWNNMMQGKIDNALINKPWMANNTNGNGNNDQPCKFINTRKDFHQNKLNSGNANNKPMWTNNLNCKIESLSSGGHISNLYGC